MAKFVRINYPYRAFRSSRAAWFLLASVAALTFASRHTLPLRAGALPHHPSIEALRTVSAFAFAGWFIAFARAATKNRIDIALIGTLNGAFALGVSLVVYGAARGDAGQAVLGALLAADGAMLGAWLAKAWLR